MKNIILQGISLEEFNKNIELMIDSKLEAFAKTYYPDRLITAKEASEVLGVCFNTLKGYVSDGIVKQITTGGDPRYSFREIANLKK